MYQYVISSDAAGHSCSYKLRTARPSFGIVGCSLLPLLIVVSLPCCSYNYNAIV